MDLSKEDKGPDRAPPPKYTDVTTIDFGPFINEPKIDAEKFTPPEGK